MPDQISSGAIKQPVSIVIAAHDQAAGLERNLPRLLTLPYDGDFEVIVVDESSTDETEDVLKQLKAQYPRLYTTYIPASSHYVSRRKLALTIGMKAAKYDWVIITEANCYPEQDEWLSTMTEAMTDDVDVVCGYTAYEEKTPARYAYLRMLTFWRQGRKPYRYDGANLALRKSTFMQRNGFLKNLKFLRGEYDFLVNETPVKCIAVVKTPEGRMRQEAPVKKAWTNKNMYYMQIRSHLSRTFVPRLLFSILQLFTHLCYLLAIAAIVVFAIMSNIIFLSASIAFLLLLIGLRTFFGYRLAKRYGEHIAIWKMPLVDFGVAWHYVYYYLRYLKSDKYDFVRK